MKLSYELDRIKKIAKDIDKIVSNAVEKGAIAAVEAAAEATPPTMDDLSGVNTRTGMLKAHWAEDSTTKPVKEGQTWVAHLCNNMQYASYVDEGHRMDKHFVPGLYINPHSGQLEYDSARMGDVGIVVGTKTQYVFGLHMTDKAQEAFDKTVDMELRRLLDDL